MSARAHTHTGGSITSVLNCLTKLEIVVFEVVGEKIPSKLRRPPDNKDGFIFTPRHNVVSVKVIHQLVGLCKKGVANGDLGDSTAEMS